MNKFHISTVSLAAVVALTFSACGSTEVEKEVYKDLTPATTCTDKGVTLLSTSITADKTLSSSTVYGLNGSTIVSNNATLTIEAGTTIVGCTSDSFLAISPNSTINANGTATMPIIFTSIADYAGESGYNATGEWGGLVIAGNAFTNKGVSTYEAYSDLSYGSNSTASNTESSGVLNYVQIRHSGYEVVKDKELNGLSLCGVGNGTTITNVAVVGGSDDGMEIWGGTVNITGLYIYNAKDDSVDTDLGYQGTIKNVLVAQHDVDKTNAYDSAVMEFGNDNEDSTIASGNVTLPTIQNFTAYAVGGGLSMKHDAGANLENVKIISSNNNTSSQYMVTFRGTTTTDDAKLKVVGNSTSGGGFCMKNSIVTLSADNSTSTGAYNSTNTKVASTTSNAYTYMSNSTLVGGTQYVNDDTSCNGSDTASVWVPYIY